MISTTAKSKLNSFSYLQMKNLTRSSNKAQQISVMLLLGSLSNDGNDNAAKE